MKKTYTVIADGRYSITVVYKGANLAMAIRAFKNIEESRYLNAHIFINGKQVNFNTFLIEKSIK